MSNLFIHPFQPISESTSPAFDASADDTSRTVGIEASADSAIGATNVRKWDYPTSRVIRIASKAGDDFTVALGTSDITAAPGLGMLVLGGTAELIKVQPHQTALAIASSTDVVVNVCLGYGN